MSGNFRGTVNNDSIINSNSIDSLSDKLNNLGNDQKQAQIKRESTVKVRFGNPQYEDSPNGTTRNFAGSNSPPPSVNP